MKLRNKKTGEIGELTSDTRAKPYRKDYAVFVKIDDIDVGDRTYFYDSFAELCEDWEDYVEPKGYWFIDTAEGAVVEHTHEQFELTDKERKEIGNCFETKEDAEKAVEKLKAWKRLKDKGFRFKMWEWEFIYNDNISGELIIKAHIDDATDSDGKYTKDLDLLFGGYE